MSILFIVTTIISSGMLLIAFLNYRLNKKEKENKALKDTLATVHNQVQIVIMNNPVFSQAPEEIQKTLKAVSASTSGSLTFTSIPVTDKNNFN